MKKSIKRLIASLLCLSVIFTGVDVYATGRVGELQNKSDALNKELQTQQNAMVAVLSEINKIEEDIAENRAEIEETEQNLNDAIIAEKDQYIAMCKRIRHNYESKEESLFTIILTAKSFSDFLNQVEYANSIYEYDNQLLDSYEATRIEIEEIKNDLEAQKAALSIKQDSLNSKKGELSAIIEDTKARKADVDTQLQAAKEEAARIAREQAAQRAAQRAAEKAQQNSQGSGGVKNADPAPVTGVSGASVVSFANQFVGNPYKWGGNSLTEGCDCSGFVVQVYKNFGINLSGSRSSAALRGVGRAVSYDNMKAGDIVCYSGHVGIYTGAGTIVEAQSTKAGITNGRSVNCKTILAIRRVI